MNAIGITLALATAQVPGAIYEDNFIETVAKVEGQYLPLVLKALKRTEMRGQPLDCYSVSVTRRKKVWRVSFLGHRAAPPPDTDTEIHVGFMPQNARCRDISFEFDGKGNITRKILARH